MASDLSSGCMETIDILDDEKEEGEISLEDVSSSEEGGIGHLTCNYVISRTRSCPDCKSWGECAPWCTMMYHSKSRRDPVKGKENRHHVREAGCTAAKHTASTLQEKNDDLVPISSDSDMEIVGLTDTSNRSKSRMKKKKRKKKDYDIITIDDLISPASDPITDFGTLKKTHYRELSPVRRSGRSRVISRSPIRRHRSPMKSRSPIRSSRSPLSRVRSPMLRRSPRRLRSPKRISPHRSPVRSTRRPSRLDSSPSTRHYFNRHGDVTKLLKKVKHLDSMGILESESNVDRSKEHQSSLKEKLSNMLKKQSDSNDNTMRFKEKTNKTAKPDIVNDADDEEDLALLRQKALETKQKKSTKSSNHGQTDMELEKKLATKNDDQDEEALQLRMIALRSAVMKKHQNRVRRGIRTNKKPSRSESPFSQSFLDDIPVPGDELLKFASPPCTPPCDSNRIEDMELDTDVEGEKEGELPYSPTDKITTHVPIDTSLLGIEPSDVSFINVNETNNKSPIFNDAERIKDVPLLTTDIASCYSNTYLMSHAYEASQYYAYSPSQQCTEIFLGSDLNDEPEKLSDHLRDRQSDNVVCDLIDGICCQVNSSTGVALTQHDVPDTHPIPVLTSLLSTPSISKTQQQVIEQSTDILFANVDSTFGKCTYEAQNISECPFRRTSPTMYAEPVSPNESIVTIDDFLETEKDSLGSPVVDKNLPTTDCIPKEIASNQAVEGETEEPLYMQGVPDITKDANKIPTLINKTLVPAPILKSNKQLQQPLPVTKKCETYVFSEPSFKSAEMQPVTVTANAQNAKSGSNFKPIKLRVARKSAPILTASVAFNEFTNENSENDTSEVQEKTSKDSSEVIEHFVTVKTVCTANNDIASARKKRKRKKEVQLPFNRYKSFSSLFQLLVEKQNNSDDYVNKDVNIIFSSNVEQQITESGPSESNNDNKAQKNLMENEESKLQNAVGNQESVSFNNITTENKSTEKSDLTSTLSAECPQERNIESHSSTNSASDNLNFASNRAPKDIDNRRQSVDEDENELRAILLASMKRKLIDINNSPSTISITANCTNSQKPIQKTLTDTASIAVINATHATMNNNAVSSTRLNSSQTEEKEINRVPSSLLVSGKKKINMDAKSLQKKMMRKSVIPASTKVVNNAKRYQNMIEQRRSNLRKFDNNTPNENVWSNANPSKTSLHVSDTQRFVISLGSDTDSESDGEKRKDSVLVPAEERHQAQDIGADFEQSLHKFLRDMRKEQEQSTVANVAKSATTRDVPLVIKDSSNMHTPLAVRHLPASQQEEYRRLKQQILEREKLKLQRKVVDNNNSANNNKLLNTNMTASSLVKSQSMSEKKNMHIKQNPDKSTESEKNSQQLPTESKKRNINAAKNSVTSNVSHTNANKNLSINVVKPILNSNSEHSSTKEAKKTIPNNLSICITNEIAPNYTGIESRTVENSSEKQSVSDKQQNNRPALRALTKEEINRKYVQVLLKSDISGRIVTINDRSALRHDTTNVSQSKKPVGNDVSTEISEEKQRNNENKNNSSVFSNASTVKLLDLTTNSSMSKQEHEDFMMETTMPLSQYETESQREINRNTSMSLSSENNNSNNAFYKSDSVNVDNKGNMDDVWDALKKDVKEELDSLINLPKAEQERYLRDTEHKLVARRYTVLDHLAEMSGNLRQWDMEKELQNSLASEVKKLKEQLKMAEERLQLQRDRVNSMGPKVSTARQKINAGRRECFKLSKICSTLGNRLMGKIYKLPEAGGQLLSDKLKEVANHTRQFTKKKRIQFNDVPENSNSNFLREIPESSKHTRIEDDLLLQEQPINDTANETGKNDTCHLKQCSDNGNLFTSESSFMLNLSQTFLNQLTPVKRKETITSLHNDEQVTPPNQDASEPKLYQSTPVEQNKKDKQRSCNTYALITSSELESSVTDPVLGQDTEQNNKKSSPSSLSTSTMKTTTTITVTTTTIATTMTTATTTTMTVKAIAPYESILSHLKTPRNTNPHGVLCPYEMMGICRDEDCQYIHQSRNQT